MLRVDLEAFVYESLLTPLKVLFVFVTVKARVRIIHAPSTSASLAFPGATHLPTLPGIEDFYPLFAYFL